MKLRLPPLIRRYRNPLAYVGVWAPYIATYQLTNRFLLTDAHELPMTALDRAIPFVPELLPVYVAYIPLYFWTVMRSENDEAANRIFYATHLQMLLALPVFLTFPVRMPREMFYEAEIYNWADAFWRWFDAPNNCLPSLHAANCCVLIHFNWHRRWRWPATLLALAVIASTLPVKQHYAIDIVAGALLYLPARWLLSHMRLEGVGPDGNIPR